MREQTINIGTVGLLELWGANNILFDKFISYFPQLKVVSRGAELYLKGKEEQIALFQAKLDLLIRVVKREGTIGEREIEKIFENFHLVTGTTYDEKSTILYGEDGKVIKARTKNQIRLFECYYKSDLIFAIGPAGTGKTYTAIALAVRALKEREVKRIILTRPAVEAGERLGFLPGDLKEKLDPYLQPLYDALGDMIPQKKLAQFIEDRVIQIAPLAYMRGRTLENGVVILDEAQNTTLGQLKMFLTRMGNNSKFIVTGDITQIDLPRRSDSGLKKGIELLKGLEGVSTIYFDREDIVRHPIVSSIVKIFDSSEEEESQ
ncbi:MAG: PhoH family protein [Bacteroidales bacterium]